MSDVDTMLTQILVQAENLTGKIDGLAINQHHAEDDIKEMKEALTKFKDEAWKKMNANEKSFTKLDKAQGELTVKLGLVPKVFVFISTLLSLVATAIALLT